MRLMIIALVVMLGWTDAAMAQDTATAYPAMAPVDQYLMADREAAIALARSAAPASIARDAEVQALGRHGFGAAVPGANGFVCLVGRARLSAADADYWHPRVRIPICLNAPAARTYLPLITTITELALSARTLPPVNETIAAAPASNRLPPMEPGRLSHLCGCRPPDAPDAVRHCRATVVRRHGGSVGTVSFESMTCREESSG